MQPLAAKRGKRRKKISGRARRFSFLRFAGVFAAIFPMPKKQNDEPEAPKKIASYTVKLDDAQMEKLRAICEARGWTPFEVAYTRFAFKADHLKVNVSAYTSGKVVVAGKGTE